LSAALRLVRLAPAWALAPLALFYGLLMQGADTYAGSALLAAALLASAALAVSSTPGNALIAALAGHRVTLLAGAAFVLWTALTAWPLPAPMGGLAHPWSEFTFLRSPSISIAPGATLLAAVFLLAPLAAFVLGALAGADRSARAWAGRVLAILTIGFALISLGDFAGDAVKRLDAGLSSANSAAVLFAALGLMSLGGALRAARRAPPGRSLPRPLGFLQSIVSAPLSTAAAFTAFMCVTLTLSRGGFIAGGLGLLMFFVVLAKRSSDGSQRGFSIPRLLLGLALPAFGVLLATSPALIERFDAGTASFIGREQLFAAHWDAFVQRPVLGHGAGAYDQLNAMAMTLENMGALRQAGAAHNIFVQCMEESGLIGFALASVAIGACLQRTIVKAFASAPGREWNAAALGVSAIFLSHGAIDFAVQVPAIGALYAYALGLLTPRPWD
jgi:O-antigen ligase